MSISIQHHDGIAVVTIDNPPVNAASQEVRQELITAVATLDDDPTVTHVVLACAGRTFVAGADIKEFGKPPLPPHLPDVVDTIELAVKPWIAAIHGTALGGGLELALACRARVAVENAKVGLPEVNLGLIPGAGGTVRLPRIVAPEIALKMIAGGKPIGAAEAKEAGLIDAIADDHLVDFAIEFARTLAPDTPATLDRPLCAPSTPHAFETDAQRMIAKARGQLSISEAVNAVERALSQDAPSALAAEREAFLRLKESDQSAALRHIFFAEGQTLSDPRCKLDPRSIGQVGVIGGGTMGAGIAAACLLAKLDVVMIERDMEAARQGRERVLETLDQSMARGLISEAQRAAIAERFSTNDRYDCLDQADLVIEAVFEDMAVKKSVFAELERHTRADAILATNTSYLDINEIAATVKEPSRVIGLHFFSPAHVMKILEIVLPDAVADDVVATGAALAKRLRKTGVLSGVCDGFIGNRIMSAYRREADYLIEDGALPWAVDAAMREFGFPIGVFEMQDLAGLDIAWAMRKRRAATRNPEERYVEVADRLCEAGRFGRKTGQGLSLIHI